MGLFANPIVKGVTGLLAFAGALLLAPSLAYGSTGTAPTATSADLAEGTTYAVVVRVNGAAPNNLAYKRQAGESKATYEQRCAGLLANALAPYGLLIVTEAADMSIATAPVFVLTMAATQKGTLPLGSNAGSADYAVLYATAVGSF